MEYAYTIRVGGPRAGQITLGGREIAFYEGNGPDEHSSPLHYAAMRQYLATGSTAGVVTVTAE